MDSVYNCYVALLFMTEESIKNLIDQYNAGSLKGTHWETALETIDGLPIDD